MSTVKATGEGGRPSHFQLALLAGAILALGSVGGCYWSRYASLMETHLELLLEFSAKLEATAADGRRVPAEAWGEFTYPLERARDFARIAARRFSGRRSLVLFERTLDVYARLVDSPDVLDRPDAAAELKRRRGELEAAVAETRAALASETS